MARHPKSGGTREGHAEDQARLAAGALNLIPPHFNSHLKYPNTHKASKTLCQLISRCKCNGQTPVSPDFESGHFVPPETLTVYANTPTMFAGVVFHTWVCFVTGRAQVGGGAVARGEPVGAPTAQQPQRRRGQGRRATAEKQADCQGGGMLRFQTSEDQLSVFRTVAKCARFD